MRMPFWRMAMETKLSLYSWLSKHLWASAAVPLTHTLCNSTLLESKHFSLDCYNSTVSVVILRHDAFSWAQNSISRQLHNALQKGFKNVTSVFLEVSVNEESDVDNLFMKRPLNFYGISFDMSGRMLLVQ